VKAQTRKVGDEVSGPAHAGYSSGVDALATLNASNRRSHLPPQTRAPAPPSAGGAATAPEAASPDPYGAQRAKIWAGRASPAVLRRPAGISQTTTAAPLPRGRGTTTRITRAAPVQAPAESHCRHAPRRHSTGASKVRAPHRQRSAACGCGGREGKGEGELRGGGLGLPLLSRAGGDTGVRITIRDTNLPFPLPKKLDRH
jgi:hypothetical protein